MDEPEPVEGPEPVAVEVSEPESSGSVATVVAEPAPSAPASATMTALPDTSGVSLLATGGGALLLAAGLLARRMIR
jgi:hypothetical protein